MKRIFSLLFALVLMVAMVGEAFGQRSFGRSGGFGGGRSTFGGGGFGRSSGSGSFGRSSGGFFGGGRSSGSFSRPSSPSYSRPSSPSFSGPRGPGSFGRSGGFGNSGRVNSSSANPSRNYGGYGGGYGGNRTTIIYGGSPYSYYGGGGFWSGYSMGVLTSPWTHWMPFHPGFYFNPPYYQNGAYYNGGFSFTRLILGIVIIGFIIWLLARLFGGGGGSKNIRYTNYR